jgi:hypothetical protein
MQPLPGDVALSCGCMVFVLNVCEIGCKDNKKYGKCMKVYEILSLHREIFERLHDFGIRFEDFKWVELYKDCISMKEDGHKMMYVVAVLAEKYKICERKVYKVIREMEKECQIGATP